MALQTIHIGNMCCQRCIEAVEVALSSLGLNTTRVELGQASFDNTANVLNEQIKLALVKKGFKIILSEDERLTEEIKIALRELIYHSKNGEYTINTLPELLEKYTTKPFRLMNKAFLKQTNQTIQKYAMLLRIEKVKSLMEEGKLNFSEIAYVAGYKTPQHLSAQFKNIVGISMQEYKVKNRRMRKSIDKV